ncbi:hypothetical protein [Streptomyces bullii]|uniref:Uncharacterized protein n=1 Tax=Streptomyces bullii TaxID=349910 RepID=A0ABW0UNY1_9ACTN
MATRSSKSSGEPENQQVPAGDEVAEEIQKANDEAQAQGFFGVETDPTPNENYSVAGVTSGAPTPETDPEYAREVRQKLDDDARQR